jgi:hypothetical protein
MHAAGSDLLDHPAQWNVPTTRRLRMHHTNILPAYNYPRPSTLYVKLKTNMQIHHDKISANIVVDRFDVLWANIHFKGLSDSKDFHIYRI